MLIPFFHAFCDLHALTALGEHRELQVFIRLPVHADADRQREELFRYQGGIAGQNDDGLVLTAGGVVVAAFQAMEWRAVFLLDPASRVPVAWEHSEC
ncbi:MAG TPA: hypothetical protein VGP82_14385 [Ktedonobacterales bacterium]|nr:hypothetical protein [Ktedonobacterales bacterium]